MMMTETPERDPLFDPSIPPRPVRPPRMLIPPGMPTLSTVCLACHMPCVIGVDWRGALCIDCRVDLDKTEAAITINMIGAAKEQDRVYARWATTIDALPDDVRDRWLALCAKRDTSLRAWQTAASALQLHAQPIPFHELVANEQTAKRAYDNVLAAIAKTEQNPSNALSSIIPEYRRMRTMACDLDDTLRRLDAALEDIRMIRNLPY
jgi:hypothetical protein